jgi:hypothetical protein
MRPVGAQGDAAVASAREGLGVEIMAEERLEESTAAPTLGKRTVTIRLSPETIVGVKTATVATGNMSAWIEDAIVQKLSKQ